MTTIIEEQTRAQRLKEAKEYLSYCEHNGESIDEIDGMTDEEIIEYADNLSERGEAAYDAWKERFT